MRPKKLYASVPVPSQWALSSASRQSRLSNDKVKPRLYVDPLAFTRRLRKTYVGNHLKAVEQVIG